MAEFVILDSNIYRKLGNRFTYHNNYSKLAEYLDRTKNHLITSVIVEEELRHHYIEKNRKSLNKFNTLSYTEIENDPLSFRSSVTAFGKEPVSFEFSLSVFGKTYLPFKFNLSAF